MINGSITENDTTQADDTNQADATTTQADDTNQADTTTTQELIFGKYKSIQDAENGYKELTKKIREKFPEAPEAYNFDYSENELFKELKEKEVDLNLSEDPLIQQYTPIFKELNLPQTTVDKLVNAYISNEIKNIPNAKEELTKLGSEAPKIIQEVNNFVGKNLSDVEKEIALQIGQTAEGVKFLHKIANLSRGNNIPSKVETIPPKSSNDLKLEARKIYNEAGGNLIGEQLKKYESLMDEASRMEVQKK
jgi:predicted transcriptional regulator